MTNFEAITNIEDGCSQEEYVDSFQHLINNGTVWSLQGWYGRTAKTLISEGYCKAVPRYFNRGDNHGANS